MEKEISVSVLSKNYWGFQNKKIKESNSPDKIKNNLCARIITCITDSFPQLKDCNENKFVRFQEQINKIISQELKKQD